MRKVEYSDYILDCLALTIEENSDVVRISNREYYDKYPTEFYNRKISLSQLHHELKQLNRAFFKSSEYQVIHVFIDGKKECGLEDYVITTSTADIGNKYWGLGGLISLIEDVFDWEVYPNKFEHINDDFLFTYNSITINNVNILLKRRVKKGPRRRNISGKTRIDVLERDNYTCQMCGTTIQDGAKLHIDHIVPVSKGGTNHKDNLQVLCSKCNLAKSNRTDLKKTKNLMGGFDE